MITYYYLKAITLILESSSLKFVSYSAWTCNSQRRRDEVLDYISIYMMSDCEFNRQWNDMFSLTVLILAHHWQNHLADAVSSSIKCVSPMWSHVFAARLWNFDGARTISVPIDYSFQPFSYMVKIWLVLNFFPPKLKSLHLPQNCFQKLLIFFLGGIGFLWRFFASQKENLGWRKKI